MVGKKLSGIKTGELEPRARSNQSAKINGIFNSQLNYNPRIKAGRRIEWNVRDSSLLKHGENKLGCVTTEVSNQRTKAGTVNQGKT